MNTLANQILVIQLKAAHSTLEQTMDGITSEVAHFQPAGTANPIARTYAHLVFSEDMFVDGFLTKDKPLFKTTFKDITGASKIHPMEWQTAYPKWLREVKLDTDKFRQHAKAVFAQTERYVETLSDKDLQKDVDMSAFGMPPKKAYDFISNLISGHAYPIMGEIAVLKGLQGLKGYPF